MKKSCLFLTALTALTLASAQTLPPQTLMTTPGTTLLEDTLSTLSKNWKAAKGTWTIVDGALHGVELPANKHPATFRQALQFEDAVIHFEFKLEGAKQISFSINDATGHLARVVIQPQGFQARKDDHDHEGSDKAVLFNNVKTPVNAGQWYSMVIELQGQEMLARLVGAADEAPAQMKVSLGTQPMLARPKANIGLTVSGTGASFRNLSVLRVAQNPGWASTKSALEQAIKP